MLPQVKLNDFIHAVSIPDTVEIDPEVFEEYFSKLSIFRTKSRFPWIYLVLPMIFQTLDSFETPDISHKFCFLSKIFSRFLERKNSRANWF